MEKEQFNNYVKRLWNAKHTDDIEKVLKEYEQAVKSDDFIDSLPPDTVVVGHTQNFIHIKTNHVPEWLSKLEGLKQIIIKSIDENSAMAPNICHHNYIQKDTYWKSCTHCGMLAPLGQ